MARSVKPWVGRTDDAMPPPRIRLRIFTAFDGVCQIAGRKITPQDKWALDHRIAIIDGGKNEEANLRPVLAEAHKVKTAEEVARKAAVDAKAKKHIGIKTTPARGMPGRSRDEREADRCARGGGKIAVPKPRSLFGDAR